MLSAVHDREGTLMRRFVFTLWAVAAAVALLLGAFGPVGAGADAASVPAPPDGPGRHAVGLSTVQMMDPARGGRTLTVDIWYPADPGSDAPTAELDLLLTRLELPGVLADPPAARGSFPLVIFSHGNGGVRFQSWFLMQALASHGFVVAAPDHAGNTALDAIAGTSDPLQHTARYGRYLTTRYAERHDLPVELLVRPEDPGQAWGAGRRLASHRESSRPSNSWPGIGRQPA